MQDLDGLWERIGVSIQYSFIPSFKSLVFLMCRVSLMGIYIFFL